MKDKLLDTLKVKTSEIAFISILALAVVIRGALTFILDGWTFLSILADGLYVLLFYFNITGGFILIGRLFFKSEQYDVKEFFYAHKYYWLAISIAVPVVTWLTDSEYYVNIDYFKNIPFFMQDNNYLPSGLLFILPILVVCFTRYAKQYSNISLINIVLMLLIVTAINYIVFYQWILYASHFAKIYFSYQVGISVYGTAALIVSFPVFYFIRKAINLNINWLYGYALVTYIFIFLGISRIFYYFMLNQ